MQAKADVAFAAIEPYEQTPRARQTLWYVTDDRFMYKPGEKVYLKGWIRWTTNGVNPDIALPVTGDPMPTRSPTARQPVATGTAALSDQGGFDLVADLPATMNLGTATFHFTAAVDQALDYPIAVQEFRAPVYAVTLDDDVAYGGAQPLVVGEEIEMRAAAKYYAGGGLSGAAIRWDAKLAAATFSPAGWSAFAFDAPRKRSEHRYGYYRRDGAGPLEEHRTAALAGDSSSTITWGRRRWPTTGPRSSRSRRP